MSIRTRTLQQLIDAVAERCDVTTGVSGVRETHAKLTARINRSIQKWKLLAAQAGDDTELLTTRTTTSASTTRDAKNWAPNQYITLPTACMLIRGMDVWSGNMPIAMMEVSEAERNDATRFWTWDSPSATTGMPVFYRLGGTNNAAAQLIQLFPYADAVYTIDVRYIPAHTDLDSVDDLDTEIEFILGGEEWVELDAALETMRSASMADAAPGFFQSLRADREAVARKMAFSLASRNTVRKIDSFARRRELRALSRSGWRGA